MGLRGCGEIYLQGTGQAGGYGDIGKRAQIQDPAGIGRSLIGLDVAGCSGNAHQLNFPGLMKARQIHQGEAIIYAGVTIN